MKISGLAENQHGHQVCGEVVKVPLHPSLLSGNNLVQPEGRPPISLSGLLLARRPGGPDTGETNRPRHRSEGSFFVGVGVGVKKSRGCG